MSGVLNMDLLYSTCSTGMAYVNVNMRLERVCFWVYGYVSELLSHIDWHSEKLLD